MPIGDPSHAIWVQAQFGTLFAGTQRRLKAFEATLVQAKLDGVTRLETGETPWAITLHNEAGQTRSYNPFVAPSRAAKHSRDAA
jgi:hypothetical protein